MSLVLKLRDVPAGDYRGIPALGSKTRRSASGAFTASTLAIWMIYRGMNIEVSPKAATSDRTGVAGGVLFQQAVDALRPIDDNGGKLRDGPGVAADKGRVPWTNDPWCCRDLWSLPGWPEIR